MLEEFTIREASKADIPSIRAMADVVFRKTYASILSPEQMEYMMDWMYSPKSLEQQMEDGHVFFIAEGAESADGAEGAEGAESADGAGQTSIQYGYVSIQHEGDDSDTELFHLQKIYIMPEAQGCGLGRALFNKAVEYAWRQCSSARGRIELNVNRNNPAVGFYEKLGMRKLRQVDNPIGKGFYMNDFIMGIDVFEAYMRSFVPQRFLTDEHYRNGHIHILAPKEGTRILGLHTPEMKAIAKEMVKDGSWRAQVQVWKEKLYGTGIDDLREEKIKVGRMENGGMKDEGMENGEIKNEGREDVWIEDVWIEDGVRKDEGRKDEGRKDEGMDRARRAVGSNAGSAMHPNPQALFHEERMIWGLVLNYAKIPLQERLSLIDEFIPSIDNWAICDNFCCNAKWVERDLSRDGLKFRSGKTESREVDGGKVESCKVESCKVESGKQESGKVESKEVDGGKVESEKIKSCKEESGKVDIGKVESGEQGVENEKLLWEFICRQIDSREEFRSRVGLILALAHFLDAGDSFSKASSIESGKQPCDGEGKAEIGQCYMGEESSRMLRTLNKVIARKYMDSDPFYIRMGAAWLFAEALCKNYEAALPYIRQRRLCRWIHNKAIQKARESWRVSEDRKQYLNSLKY